MELTQVETAIAATPKGSNIVVEWLRPCKTRKGVVDQITKAVRMVGRIGIDYDKINDVQEKRESGELPRDPQPLPWGSWYAFPYLITHKGGFYLRLYNGTSAVCKPDAHFFRNGVEVSKEEIAPLLLASEFSDRDGDCFTCKVENMTRVNHEAAWLALQVNVDQEKVTVESRPVAAKELATL